MRSIVQGFIKLLKDKRFEPEKFFDEVWKEGCAICKDDGIIMDNVGWLVEQRANTSLSKRFKCKQILYCKLSIHRKSEANKKPST